jgi:hypothetical protein
MFGLPGSKGNDRFWVKVLSVMLEIAVVESAELSRIRCRFDGGSVEPELERPVEYNPETSRDGDGKLDCDRVDNRFDPFRIDVFGVGVFISAND